MSDDLENVALASSDPEGHQQAMADAELVPDFPYRLRLLADAMHSKRVLIKANLRGAADELSRLLAENAALRAELEGVRKDAERYRWLRDKTLSVDWSHRLSANWWQKEFRKSGPEMDAAIDAAIARGKA